MLRFVLMVAIATTLYTASSHAASQSEKDKCLKKVVEIGEIQASPETPGIGEIAQQELDDLMEVATHLCVQGNFVYADKLLKMARGMLASE